MTQNQPSFKKKKMLKSMNISPKPDIIAAFILVWKGGMSLAYLTTYILILCKCSRYIVVVVSCVWW